MRGDKRLVRGDHHVAAWRYGPGIPNAAYSSDFRKRQWPPAVLWLGIFPAMAHALSEPGQQPIHRAAMATPTRRSGVTGEDVITARILRLAPGVRQGHRCTVARDREGIGTRPPSRDHDFPVVVVPVRSPAPR